MSVASISYRLAKIRPAWQAMTPVGRATAAVAVCAWLLGLRLGWKELFLVAACAGISMLVAVGFVLGRPTLEIGIDLERARVEVGTPASGQLVATNQARVRMRPLRVEVPVGANRTAFELPSLAAGDSHSEDFRVATPRRCVITIGPARAIRADPLGLLRRHAIEPKVTELFVHPRIIGLDSLSPGLRRDLEGETTRDLSTADLAFRSLREYVAGDDRRYVHWRSTAKAGKLLVRQFQDTRRSRLTLVVDGAAGSYGDEDEFETAMSVAGSIGVRAARDQQDVSVIAAGHATSDANPRRILDTLCRGELAEQGRDLVSSTREALRIAPDTSVLFLLTGSVIPFSGLSAAAVYCGPDVSVTVIRVEPDAPPGLSRSGALTVLGLRGLADLPALLRAAGGV